MVKIPNFASVVSEPMFFQCKMYKLHLLNCISYFNPKSVPYTDCFRMDDLLKTCEVTVYAFCSH